MPVNHRIGRLVFGFGVGFLVAFLAFKWITNPAPRAERQLEESIVMLARQQLADTLSLAGIEMVDPLAPNRKIGKSYVYRTDHGWEVSGYYRRGKDDLWHPFLMSLESSGALRKLKIGDAALIERARADPVLEALP